MPTVRPFVEADYAALSTMLHSVWPERNVNPATLQHTDRQRRDGYFFQRWVVEVNRAIAGACEFGEPSDSYRPGKYIFDIAVAPAQEHVGIGSALYAQLLQTLAQRPQPLQLLACRTCESKPQAVQFLQRRGFTQVMRSPVLRLDVQEFDSAKFAAVIATVEATGIQLCSLAELAASDPAWQRQIYELDWECTLDEPLPDTPTKPAFEHYAAEIFEHPNFLPAAWFVALDRGRYVGMTAANHNASNPQQLDTFFTGIVRSHRRRGLATALKLLVFDYAKQNGYTAIRTDSEETNPMLQLNLALGFQPEPALLFFQKRLE